MKTELTGKQRAQLRSMANDFDTIFQIGKGGITQETVYQIDNALEARELIKLRVLDACPHTSREAADIIAERTNSAEVSVVGTRFVLYRKSRKNPQIILK